MFFGFFWVPLSAVRWVLCVLLTEPGPVQVQQSVHDPAELPEDRGGEVEQVATPKVSPRHVSDRTLPNRVTSEPAR